MEGCVSWFANRATSGFGNENWGGLFGGGLTGLEAFAIGFVALYWSLSDGSPSTEGFSVGAAKNATPAIRTSTNRCPLGLELKV